MRDQKTIRALYYGRRKTPKLVRCYHKHEIKAFRVELELHSRLLRDIATPDDFQFLADVIYPKHFEIVDVAWDKLQRHLKKRFGSSGSTILAGAQKRARSLRRLKRYLKKKGVVNVHRFLVPTRLSKKVGQALVKWACNFKASAL